MFMARSYMSILVVMNKVSIILNIAIMCKFHLLVTLLCLHYIAYAWKFIQNEQ